MLANRSFFSIHSINSISRLETFEFFRNISSNNQHWSHSSYSRVSHRIYLLIIANRHLSFVAKIVSIIETENQSIFRQNFQYWQSHISIWIIFDFWEFSRITSVDFANQFRFFNIDDEIDNISNSNFKSVFQISLFSFNISIRSQYWNYSFFSKLLQNNTQLSNKSTFFFSRSDDFSTRKFKHFQFEIFLFWFRKRSILRYRKLFSTFSTMFASILRVEFAE